jgi:hypothetical protein
MLPLVVTEYFIVIGGLVESSKSFFLLCDGIVVIDILYICCHNVTIRIKITRRYIYG